MSIQRQLLLLLLTVCLVYCLNKTDCAGTDKDTPNCIAQCIHDAMATSGNQPLKQYLTQHGETYEVVGMTDDCLFFSFFWNNTEFSQKKSELRKFRGTGYCAGKKIMMVRTTGENRKMVLMVDTVGRRVRVQSVYDGKADLVESTDKEGGDFLFIEVSATDRRLHAYSQSLPKGYTFETVFNANYHVYVVARNQFQFALFELMVELDPELNIVPYLRQEHVDIDPLLQPPFADPGVTVFHSLDLNSDRFFIDTNEITVMSCGIWQSIVSLYQLMDDPDQKNEFAEQAEKVRPDERTVLLKFVEELKGRFENETVTDNLTLNMALECWRNAHHSRVETWGMSMWDRESKGSTLAIPLVSALGQTNRGVSKEAGGMGPDILYEEKQKRFYIERTECVNNMNHYMLYHHGIAKERAQTNFTFKPNRYLFSTRRSFNPRHSHRRMASPHAIVRINNKHKFRQGSATLSWIFAVILVSLFVTFLIVHLATWGRRKFLKKKRQRSDTSSVNTN